MPREMAPLLWTDSEAAECQAPELRAPNVHRNREPRDLMHLSLHRSPLEMDKCLMSSFELKVAITNI